MKLGEEIKNAASKQQELEKKLAEAEQKIAVKASEARKLCDLLYARRLQPRGGGGGKMPPSELCRHGRKAEREAAASFQTDF